MKRKRENTLRNMLFIREIYIFLDQEILFFFSMSSHSEKRKGVINDFSNRKFMSNLNIIK